MQKTKAEGYKILWIHEHFQKPLNGLMLFENEELWFSYEPINPEEHKDGADYYLYKLDDDTMEKVKENHKAYCEYTGEPFFHGDPKIIKSEITKEKNLKPKNEDEIIEGLMKPLLIVKAYTHKFLVSEIKGEFVNSINKTEIINLNVPRLIKRE